MELPALELSPPRYRTRSSTLRERGKRVVVTRREVEGEVLRKEKVVSHKRRVHFVNNGVRVVSFMF